MMRRITMGILLAALLLAAGCAKRPTREPLRLDILRDRDDYTLTHVVAPGETLRVVADRYYGDPDRATEIADLNGIVDPDHLAVGDRLVLAFAEDEWAAAEVRYRARVPYNRGVDALNAGRLEEAENAFDDALEIDPTFDDAGYNRALVLLRRGRHEAAETALADLRARRPDDPDILLALANSLFFQIRLAESIEIYREVLSIDPNHIQGAYGLARALTEAGLKESAITAWEAYLRLDDDSAWATRAREQLRTLGSGR